MRKFLRALLMLCVIFCLLPVSVFAASSTYDLDALGMRIDIPSDLVVFTRNINADDPNLSTYGFTKDEFLSLMQEQDIYFDAWDQDVDHEIVILMEEDLSGDYHRLSDTRLAAIISSYKSGFADAGINLIDSDIYRHSQAKFTKLYLSQTENGETLHGLQYHTIYDGKSIIITFYSYCGEIDAAEASAYQSIIDSICFDAEPQPTPAPAQTEAFTYTNPDIGMTFTVPANWVEMPTSEENEYVDARFGSTTEDGLSIVFLSLDLFESEEFKAALSAEELQSVNRHDIQNNALTAADIAEVCGCEESQVSMVTYGGKEYYSAEEVATITEDGITISTPISYLIRCENGYAYMFQFNGTKDSPYFSDLEQLVSSAQYPMFEADETAPETDILLILGSLAITLVAYSAFPLIYAGVRNTPISKKNYIILCYVVNFLVMMLFISIQNAPSSGGPYILWTWLSSALGIKTLRSSGVLEGSLPSESIAEQTAPASEADIAQGGDEKSETPPVQTGDTPIRFCWKCGYELQPNSAFCSRCGTAVTKE